MTDLKFYKTQVCLWKKTACQTILKALDISRATAWLAPYLLKALVILPDATIRVSSAYWEDLKPYWKSEKRLHFFRWLIKKPIIYKSFKDFTNLGKKTNRTVVSCSSLSLNIFIQWPQLGPPNNQENKITSDTY